MMTWFAHSAPDGHEPLADHLDRVGTMAGDFAAAFDARDWGRTVGLLHDLGKACDAFQRRLDGDPAPVDHISAGTRVAAACGPLGRLAAYAVAGHHGGLPDAAELHERLARAVTWDPKAQPVLPPLDVPRAARGAFGAALFVRMVFSCLSDADFLATEAFYRPDTPRWRGRALDAGALSACLAARLDAMMAEAEPGAVNLQRRRVLEACRAKAAAPPGLFTLSVPTGGGKTLAAMSFALDHARHWGKRRVIAVLPYTSIIDQNAAIYRDILGADNVLEHHSAFRHPADHDGCGPADPDARDKLRMAQENWDWPVVVTTSVQFFESLFSNRPSRCRKLHNLAGSVIILDEAQMMPVAFLEPCLHALRGLVENYGCSLILSTATQPALGDPAWLGPAALTGMTEIIDDPAALHRDLARVRYRWAGAMDDDTLAATLRDQPQALTVVNTRRHAQDLFARLADLPDAAHLSAAMTPDHRRRVLKRIRARLADHQPCRVVATQVVECGVDVDFPMVLRALAGLDSIIQAAGRCNRSGRLNPADAEVTVFTSPDHPVPPLWTEHANLARLVLTERFADDPASPAAVRWYFQELFKTQTLDRADIGRLLRTNAQMAFAFRSAARAFQMIGDDQIDVVVPENADAAALIRRLERETAHPALLRALQPCTVQLRPRQAKALHGALRLIGDRVWVLDRDAYDDQTGVPA